VYSLFSGTSCGSSEGTMNSNRCRMHAKNTRCAIPKKRDKDNVINERIADSMFNRNTRDRWLEIKRVRSNKSGAS